jgi:hypothetical protein
MNDRVESSAASSSSQPEAYIVNLSSLHTLHLATLSEFFKKRTEHPALKGFLDLCQSYSGSIADTLCCHSSFFGKVWNFGWLIKEFIAHGELIQAYKANRMYPVNGMFVQVTTDIFLDQLLSIFNFLRHVRFKESDLVRIYDKRKTLYSFSKLPEISKQEFLARPVTFQTEIAKALLEEAYNKVVEYTEQDSQKWNYLFSQVAPGTPVYLISNSNELNVMAFLHGLLEAGHIKSMPDTLIALPDERGLPTVRIPGTEIFLCLSFNFCGLKGDDHHSGTPGIISTLLTRHHAARTIVLSQIPDDLRYAALAFVPDHNRFSADTFYASAAANLHIKSF